MFDGSSDQSFMLALENATLHPSGVAESSRADEVLTQTLKTTVSLVDVRVLEIWS